MCYDYYLLKPIIDYYDISGVLTPENFSLRGLNRKNVIIIFSRLSMRNMNIGLTMKTLYVELHHNQYEDQPLL